MSLNMRGASTILTALVLLLPSTLSAVSRSGRGSDSDCPKTLEAIFSEAHPDASDWINADNFAFYQHELPPDRLEELAHMLGISENRELETVFGGVLDGQSVLLLGGGYGRVADWLSVRKPLVNVTILEISPTYLQHLRNKYSGVRNMRVLKQDLVNSKLRETFSMVYWPWGGLTEFNASEQQVALRRVAEFVEPLGRLFVELPDVTSGRGLRPAGKSIRFDGTSTSLHLHFPSLSKLNEMLANAGLKQLVAKPFVTRMGQHRMLVAIGKKRR